MTLNETVKRNKDNSMLLTTRLTMTLDVVPIELNEPDAINLNLLFCFWIICLGDQVTSLLSETERLKFELSKLKKKTRN